MVLILDEVFILSAIIAGVLGASITYFVIMGKDKMAMSIINGCEVFLDEYGEDIKRRDPKLYKECRDVIDDLKEMAVDGTPFMTFIRFASTAPMVFKKVIEFYGVKGDLKDIVKNIK